jgi:predicted CxxxxCH...CXXCH cytochrome family protein
MLRPAILLLALLAPASWAQDQSLPPDGENNPADVFNDGRTACNAAACNLDVDEGADAGGDDLDLCTDTQNATILFTFPTPSANPDGAANAQTLDLIMTRTDDDGTCNDNAGGGDPDFTVELYCNGSPTGVTPFNAAIISAVDQDHTATFTFPAACAADGSDFEILVTMGRSGGSPANRRWAGIEAVEWEVTHSTTNAPPTVTIDNPADTGSIGGGASYVIDGTAADADGTVQSVDLTIARPSGAPTEWWNGTGWQGTSTTVAATSGDGFANWSYTWNWTADMDGTSVAFTAVATDDLSATGNDTNTASVDTEAPRIDTGVRFTPDPTSGDVNFTLASNWLENSPGTPRFDYDLNNTTLNGWSAGAPPNDNNSSITYGVGLTGSDYFVDIRSDHADTFGNGPTLSQDSGPFYVLPLTPNAPTVDNGTNDSLDVTINANPGEGGTGMLYAIRCDTAGGFVQADNTCDVTETWQDLTGWGGSTVTVIGLSPATSYDFSVAAGNPNDGSPTTGERSASAYGTAGTGSTIAGNASPTVTINNPADTGSIGGGAFYVIDGTAADADGTVQSVDLTIARPSGSPTQWWNGTSWQGTSSTVAANNTGTNFSTWSYTWNWTADMDSTSVEFTAEATDDLAATGSDTNTANVDTEAPRIATGVRFSPDPTSGDTDFTLASDWTEANAGTPRFAYDRNNTGLTAFADGSAGNNSSITYGVPLTGSDYFVDIRSEHTDSFGNGPTLSQSSGPFYVLPLTPPAPSVSNNGSTDSLGVTINANPSEGGAGMVYAIRCDTSGGFVQADNTCGGTAVWQTETTVTVTGLSAGTSYSFSVAAGNPNDATPTTGERSASAYGAGSSATTSAPAVNDVTVNPPTAVIDDCNQITVTVTFTGDDNGDSTTVFEHSPNGVNGWTPVASCGAVGGPSPRICVDTTVADNSTNYYRTDYTDADGVTGADPSAAIGPFDTTPYCDVNGTTIDSNAATATTCRQITTVSHLSGDDNGDGYTEVQYNTINSFPATVACPQIGGASPRECRIAKLTEGQDYWLRFHHVDPDGVTAGAAPQDEIIGPINTSTCLGNFIAPTILVLSPSRDAVIGGTDRIKVQVFDAPIGSVSVVWSVDGGATTAASQNANYDCGLNCGVFEFDLNTTTTGVNPLSLGYGRHYLTIAATDADGHTAELSQAFRVNNVGDRARGSGLLLRRTHGAQLCIDCHNLPTHSSQATGAKYGNWAVDCVTCHTPHRTTNIYLIDDTIETPNSGGRSVRFESLVGAAADSSAGGAASHVNEDSATQTEGVCEVCHTKTVSFTGDARWRNDDSGGNIDTHYDSVTEQRRCTECHAHELGFLGVGGGCNSCHNSPPTIGKHGIHDQVWDSTDNNTATDYDEVASHATATQYGFACKKCHAGVHLNEPTNNPSHDGSLANPFLVETLFDTSALPSNPSGGYSGTYNENQDQGPDTRYWSWSDGTCSNLYCHSDADPLGGGGPSYATATWDQVATLNCTSCHDDAGATTNLSNAHRKHTDTGAYDYTCNRCHVNTVTVATNDAIADKREHVDGEKDVVFDGSGVDNSGGNYNGSPSYTCSNTYCHSDGTTQSPPYTSSSIAWNTTATCASCHDGDANAATTMSTGKHENHIDNTTILGDNYECAACHDATVSAGDNEAITGFGNHVNATSTVSGTFVDATYTSPTCSNSYCHSSGQASGGGESFEYYVTPDWFTATADAMNCLGCHGQHSTATVSSSFGEPDYPNQGAGLANANSHSTHVATVGDCTSCHNTTTSNGTAVLSGAPHTDGNRDVVIASAWDTNGGTSNYNTGNKTCSGIACHGAGSPQWGDSLVCLDCHTGTEGGALGDGAPNAVDDEWTTDGHGSAAGGSMSSSLGACDYCHQLDSAHTPTASINPYRLRVGVQDLGTDPSFDFGATPGNQVCLTCHGTGNSGVSKNSAGVTLTTENGADVDTAHFGTKHQQPEGGEMCWDCHDPHGVPTNVLMVPDQVSKTSDQYGIPTATVLVDFTDNTAIGNGGFVQSTNDGICQSCHDPNSGDGDETSDLGPTKYWRSDGTDDADGPGGNPEVASNHNIGKLCSDCHFHNADFKGSGGDCLSCHGDASGAPARRAVEADFGKNSHHVGASQDATGAGLFTQPTMGGALTNFDCVVCHAEGFVNANNETDTTGQPHQDGVIDLRNADSTTAYWSYDKDSITGASNTWMSGNTSWETETSTQLDPFCISCHDVDGAAATFNSGANEGLGFTGSATNPFADSAITNENDQVDRGAVVNIRNMVDAYVDNSNNSITPVDREGGGDPRTADGRPDPTGGIYSRHAIRGDGTYGSGSVYGSSQIFTNRWEARPTGSWNDTSLMGCADCHTTDGANGADGNAHGSGTEYLLKNKDGSSTTEPGFDIRNADVSQINCYKCHNWEWYARERNFEHTDNNTDHNFSADQTGSASRNSGNGNIFGLPCTNCHGGNAWGAIHGTSETFTINDGGGTPTQRQAYRFMNGASLRYFDPNGWNTATFTCYTLSDADSFGSCTQHPAGNGKTYGRAATDTAAGPVQRDIQY